MVFLEDFTLQGGSPAVVKVFCMWEYVSEGAEEEGTLAYRSNRKASGTSKSSVDFSYLC